MGRRFGKVLIVPCSGSDRACGLLAREAALVVVEELRPNASDAVCLASLAVGDAEAREKARSLPTIAVDGCSEGCASSIVKSARAGPTVSLCVADRLGGRAIPPGLNVGWVDDTRVAWSLALEIAVQVDEIMEALGW